MHKRIVKNFRQRYIHSPGIDVIWTSDLMLLPKYQFQNDGYKYILTIMDVFSKYAWVHVTKNKDKKTIANAFEDILKISGRFPRRLWSFFLYQYNKLQYNATFYYTLITIVKSLGFTGYKCKRNESQKYKQFLLTINVSTYLMKTAIL